MSIRLRRSPGGHRLVKFVGPIAICGIFAGLAAGLQARQVTVTGTRRFASAEVEEALKSALGKPTVSLRAETLRDTVLAIAWVADATVKIGLDGTIECFVSERTPVAIGLDGSNRMLLDFTGRVLAPAPGSASGPELHGFAAYPEQRRQVLRSLAALEQAWGTSLSAVDRVGPSDIALHFPDTPCTIVADPRWPEAVARGRLIVDAWQRRTGSLPSRADVRSRAWVALVPAPATEEGEAGT